MKNRYVLQKLKPSKKRPLVGRVGVGDLGTWVTLGDSCGVRRAFTAAAARPATEGIEFHLQDARAALRARENAATGDPD